ncbi:hypothetical protein [Mycoplasma todarodis]|uniref:hypothetical protein n=1 Tax=Mycoplasma todarodis TaxID=1937191 RepID=UPI003B29DE56
MNKTKKITLGAFSALATIATPIVAVVSCGEKKEEKSYLEELESKFEKSLKENVSLRIPYYSKEQDPKAALEEYKGKIKQFIDNESHHGGSLIDLIKDEKEKKKVSQFIQANTLLDSFKASDIATDKGKKLLELENKYQVQLLKIKEFIFFDETGKNKEVKVKLEDKVLEKLSKVFLASSEAMDDFMKTQKMNVKLREKVEAASDAFTKEVKSWEK